LSVSLQESQENVKPEAGGIGRSKGRTVRRSDDQTIRKNKRPDDHKRPDDQMIMRSHDPLFRRKTSKGRPEAWRRRVALEDKGPDGNDRRDWKNGAIDTV
jgi:hypothetical protein